MPVELEIRHFTPQDVEPLHFLLAEALPAEVRPRFGQLVSLLLDEDVAAMMAAVADAASIQLAGALVLRGEPARSRVAIQLLAVHPDYRRLGLGRRLMARALAVARGCAWSSVVCPPGSSPAGAAFLSAMDFVPAGDESTARVGGWQHDLAAEG